ncbi:MAG: zinc ribbon domain-containing protein [Kiritimatiellae bacterium]|nr:zinc ribbon domain-containing protein [Kiritimatiellia bacterium]
MPIYEYQVAEGAKGCPFCTRGFEQIQTLAEPKLEKCPECGAPVVRVISAPSLGKSQSSLDDRAKAAGFTKLKRLGKGEYEKQY